MNPIRNPITHVEISDNIIGTKLNWLRAAVLGANDGIVSVASVVIGVAAASNSKSFILTAGVASLVAGALSMAVGEYVSVSTQRDTEKSLLEKERIELETMPEEELEELTQIYQKRGLSRSTAEIVANELTTHDAFSAHVEAELKIDPNNLTKPLNAAYASGVAFLSGAIIPIILILVSPVTYCIPATAVAVIIALIITGTLSANAGGANKTKAVIRVVLGGVIAMLVTFGIGKLFRVSGI